MLNCFAAFSGDNMYLGFEVRKLGLKHLADQHENTSVKYTTMVYMPKTALESKRIDIEQLQLERNELAKQETADIERIIADHKYRDLNTMPSGVAS